MVARTLKLFQPVKALLNPLGRLCADAIDHFQAAAGREFLEIVE